MPTDTDSDDDGILDGAEDWDGDGLTNLTELSLGLEMLIRDSDGEGLSDGEEVNDAQTDPLDSDSDDDGRSDLVEALLTRVSEVTESNYDDTVETGYTLLVLSSTWCGHSYFLNRSLYRALTTAPEHIDIGWHLASNDPGEASSISRSLGAYAFPLTLLLGPGGTSLGGFYGAVDMDDLEDLIGQLDAFASDGTITPSEVDDIELDHWDPNL
jgi:hypothetical protein